jgi:hypothetical protein
MGLTDEESITNDAIMEFFHWRDEKASEIEKEKGYIFDNSIQWSDYEVTMNFIDRLSYLVTLNFWNRRLIKTSRERLQSG